MKNNYLTSSKYSWNGTVPFSACCLADRKSNQPVKTCTQRFLAEDMEENRWAAGWLKFALKMAMRMVCMCECSLVEVAQNLKVCLIKWIVFICQWAVNPNEIISWIVEIQRNIMKCINYIVNVCVKLLKCSFLYYTCTVLYDACTIFYPVFGPIANLKGLIFIRVWSCVL